MLAVMINLFFTEKKLAFVLYSVFACFFRFNINAVSKYPNYPKQTSSNYHRGIQVYQLMILLFHLIVSTPQLKYLLISKT